MPFSLGPIGGPTKQDIEVKNGGNTGGRYNQQDKDDSIMANDISGNDIPPDLAVHDAEPAAKQIESPRSDKRRRSSSSKKRD